MDCRDVAGERADQFGPSSCSLVKLAGGFRHACIAAKCWPKGACTVALAELRSILVYCCSSASDWMLISACTSQPSLVHVSASRLFTGKRIAISLICKY